MIIDINKAIDDLRQHNVLVQRSPFELSFGDKETCKNLFIETFKGVDLSVKNYKHLPEYDHVIDWMIDAKGKGLFMSGDCGRGKSIILTGVIPTLFFHKYGKVIRYFSSTEIPEKVKFISIQWAISIDDLGLEPMINDFGEKYEGFNRIIDIAEARLSPLFISTNLTSEDLLARYGERTLDRIKRLCKIVKFKGESLRK
jgi:DNA replication protein DnaC